jgi:hypothetical protein
MDNVILVEGGIILVFGVAYVLQNNRPVTPVFVGALGLMLIVGLLEVFGSVPGEIGKALLSLATFSVVIAEGGNFITGLQNAQGHKAA